MSVLHTEDLEIYYEINGKGNLLVLIHGLGSGTRDWENQVPALARHHRVITFDVRGHGRTGAPPGPYSVPLFASDTARLMEALGVGPAHIAGLSMGGMIAFQLALDRPELVRSLSIINSGPELILHTVGERAVFCHRKLIVRVFGMRQMGKMLAKNLLPEPGQKALARRLVRRWGRNDRRAYLAALDAIIGWSVADRIHTITCPTLIMSADKDYTPVAWKAQYAARIPGAELVIIRNSRHLSPLDQPVQVNRALAEFLSQGG
ncbi:3-oxoadipate enol-lactonase [Desulfonema ishimotonii]|uniref:3-oxoadipate enol-lactonase n=1 Tax=Desulfonema ishimotonii TaxID=45657 RepID=A0A401G3G3_9BACT|nr:alpha/beta hydrolase [Desulfonema ishimotonii]GBC63655.1 3-oxoadipate enol-lactonase [Desulfonema ishimotonii]